MAKEINSKGAQEEELELRYSHGLRDESQPLELKKILRSCFANPDRLKYPEFTSKICCWQRPYPLYTGSVSYKSIFSTLSPKLVEKFDNAKIFVHNKSRLWDHLARNPLYDPVDKAAFCETIKQCRWYGPYRWESGDWFYFISINQEGDNQFYVSLELDLTKNSSQTASFYFYWSNSYIGKTYSFSR